MTSVPREEALLFGRRTSLVGVLTRPADGEHPPTLPAVLLLNAGILHRVGPNRLYVRLARTLAGLGFLVLRFDFSGIGDSLPSLEAVPFRQTALSDVQQAMDTLQAIAGHGLAIGDGGAQFVLIGLCSGATVSLCAALADPRVVGAVLINPNAYLHDDRDEALSAYLRNRSLLRHYCRIALSSSYRGKNLRKIFTGRLNTPLLRQTLQGMSLRRGKGIHQHPPHASVAAGRRPGEQATEQLRTLQARGVRLLHVFSEGDEGLDYFRYVLGKDASAFPVEIIRGANHTFTPLWSQDRLVQLISDWAIQFLHLCDSPERTELA